MTRGGGLKHLWDKIVDKFSLKNHTHTKNEITDFPTSYSINQIDGLENALDKKVEEDKFAGLIQNLPYAVDAENVSISITTEQGIGIIDYFK